jgi:hypothetical protein
MLLCANEYVPSDKEDCLVLAALLAENTTRFVKGKGKGKAIPLQAWTGNEGSRRVRLPDFKTIGT